MLLTPTLLINWTCKENCQLDTSRSSHPFLTLFRNKHPTPGETYFGIPAPQGKPTHFHQSDVVQGNALRKTLTLTDLSFGCKRYLFFPLDFKTCQDGIIQACRPQLWAIICERPQFSLGSLPGNSEKNQFLGLNMLYNKPIPSIFERNKLWTWIVNLWPESWLWFVFCFSQAPSEVLITFIFYCGHWHSQLRDRPWGSVQSPFNFVQPNRFDQIILTSLNHSFEMGAKTLYLAEVDF